MSTNPILTQQISDSRMAEMRRQTASRRNETTTVASHSVLGVSARIARPLTRWLHV